MVSIPASIARQFADVADVAQSLDRDVEELLGLLTGGSELKELERARVLLALGQAALAMHSLQLRGWGMDPELQPALHKERERLTGFAKRVSKAEAAEELQKARPTLALNVAAANRFIDAAIPDLSSQQREMLRAASSGVKRQAAEQDAAARPRSKRGAGRTGAPGQSGGRSGSRDHAMAFLQQVMQEGVKTEAALPPQQHGDSDSSDA